MPPTTKSITYDAHARPPESLRNLFKDWRKKSLEDVESAQNVLDPFEPDQGKVHFLPGRSYLRIDSDFINGTPQPDLLEVEEAKPHAFEVVALPGLQVFPAVLSADLQLGILNKLLHRDLSNPAHKTNLHLHYDVQYPFSEEGSHAPSLFSARRDSLLLPKDPTVHKPINFAQVLETKLRWMTLGGQYDWTNKIYPDEIPPQFPPDLAAGLKKLFPTVDAQAAIVNFYSPGDTLSVHRDVSEQCDKPLISISLGCDAVFLVGNEDGREVATIRLRSGDAVLMSGKSRYAWHGVPKILANTCPTWLRDWPDIPADSFRDWRGWMNEKRVNLNVRQMTQELPQYGVPVTN